VLIIDWFDLFWNVGVEVRLLVVCIRCLRYRVLRIFCCSWLMVVGNLFKFFNVLML